MIHLSKVDLEKDRQMDGGQFRVPQRTSRGTVSRPEPTRRPVEKPQPPVESASIEESIQATPSSRQPKIERQKHPAEPKGRKKLVITAVVTAVLVIVGAFGWLMLHKAPSGIDSSKYQAVFLVNGDTYFGKLEPAEPGYMKLTNIYYIQSQAKGTIEDSQQTKADDSNIQLIKLGDEIYAPEDMMIISRDQIMLYENLKSEGKVAKAIDKYKQ